MDITRPLIAVLMASSLLLAGCGGGGATVTASSTTMGQELQDLEKSHKDGLINEKEYKRARKAILERYD